MNQNGGIATQGPAVDASNELVPVLMRFARLVRRRRQVMIVSLAVSAAAGAVYYAAAPRLYLSSAKLLIVQQKQDQLATVGDHDSSDKIMATQREIVASPVVLKEAIRRLGPEDRVDLVDQPPHKWVDVLSQSLGASTTRRTNFVDVSFRSKRPETAAAVVRAVMGAYLDFVKETHQGTAGELKHLLIEKRLELEHSLAEKQQLLQQQRQQLGHLSVSSDDGVVEPAIQRALKLHESLMEVQTQRLELQGKLRAIETAIERGENVEQYLAGIGDAVGEQYLLMTLGISPQDMSLQAEQEGRRLEAQEKLRRLSAFLGPNHPTIVELNDQIRGLGAYLAHSQSNLGRRIDPSQNAQLGTVVHEMLQQAVDQSEQREKQLADSYEQARQEAASRSGGIFALRSLEQDVARIRNLHDLLYDRIAAVDFRQVQAPIQATVVKEPLPSDTPVSPRLRLVLMAVMALGLCVGGAIIYVQDILDDRFDSPEDLTSQLGVPVLALVSKLEPLTVGGMAGVHTFANPASPSTEAFRTLRTALTLSNEPTNRLLISSSEPGDGKTTVGVNLAVAFAQTGKRTLLIDADLRKPGLTARLDLKRQPGVANLLLDDRPVSIVAAEHLRSTDVPGLAVLPAGTRQPNPAELLNNARLAELLGWAEANFDQVLVDCPPVLAVSDAQIVGRLVDGGVLVVRPDRNHRRHVIRAVDSFHATGCRTLGVVANGISSEMTGYDGYGYGYGYGHDDESDPSDPCPLPNHDVSPSTASLSKRAPSPSRPRSTDDGAEPPAIQPRRAA